MENDKKKSIKFHVLLLMTVIVAVIMLLYVFLHQNEIRNLSVLKEKNPVFQEAEIIFAVHSYASPIELSRSFSPLIEYLSKSINRKIVLKSSVNYEKNIDLVGKDEVDIAFIGPAGYVTMVELYGKKKLICCLATDGTADYRGYIITHKDNPATCLKDLQGKSFASSSRKSTMSYVVPRFMFVQAGLSFPDEQLRIVGSHNNVALNVLARDINAGAIREKTYRKYKDRDLKIIAITPGVCEHPILATNKLDTETFKKIKDAIFSIKKVEDVQRILKPVKESISKLLSVKDSDYDPLRKMISAVKKDEKLSIKKSGGLK